jgi:hypothetical protein
MPLTLRTARQMLADGHELSVYCRACDRWKDIDLKAVVDIGLGDEVLLSRSRHCMQCGGFVEVKISPPYKSPASAREG